MKTYHVKKDDKVMVNAGNYRGSEATVKAVLTGKDRVVLEIAGDAEHKLGKRTVRKSKANPNGGLIERSVSVHVSNVVPTAETLKAKQEAKAARLAKKNEGK